MQNKRTNGAWRTSGWKIETDPVLMLYLILSRPQNRWLISIVPFRLTESPSKCPVMSEPNNFLSGFHLQLFLPMREVCSRRARAGERSKTVAAFCPAGCHVTMIHFAQPMPLPISKGAQDVLFCLLDCLRDATSKTPEGRVAVSHAPLSRRART